MASTERRRGTRYICGIEENFLAVTHGRIFESLGSMHLLDKMAIATVPVFVDLTKSHDQAVDIWNGVTSNDKEEMESPNDCTRN